MKVIIETTAGNLLDEKDISEQIAVIVLLNASEIELDDGRVCDVVKTMYRFKDQTLFIFVE